MAFWQSRSTRTVAIRDAHVLQYHMPLKKAFATARGATRGGTNYLIRLTAAVGGEDIQAVGEANPRRRLTGDEPEASWRFVVAVVDQLPGRELAIGFPQEAVRSVTELMTHVRSLADEHATDSNRYKPFRGTLFGIECALLDLVARALGITVAQLLGQQRDSAHVTSSTISAANSVDAVGTKLGKQLDLYPVTRLKGKGDGETDLELLRLAWDVARDSDPGRMIWIDLNEGLSPDDATEFTKAVVREMAMGTIAPSTILEQPVPKREWKHLPELQRIADAELAAASPVTGGAFDLRIMPDESLSDVEDLERLLSAGPCRAINIKAQKAGGLLPSLELARAALERDRETRVYIGGMLAVSDIAVSALRSLALAMPRLDYLTSVPPTNVEARIGRPLVDYRPGTTVLEDPREPGLGARLALEAVVPYVERHHRTPEPFGDLHHLEDRRPNLYASDHLEGLGTLGLDSHVLEREALRRGLRTLRVSPVMFFAGGGNETWPIGFHWTASVDTARLAMYVTGNKQVTRTMLARAGVPVPRGRKFPANHRRAAIEYARELGFPVVVKPIAGTGGYGVAANIQNETDVAWAIDALEQTKHRGKDFVVEQHIEGEDYRFFVLGDRVLSVLRRTPGAVIGDGRLTVAELILQKNDFRAQNPHLRTRPIKVGSAATFQLGKQGLTFESVPVEGQHVVLTLAGNLSQGGDSIEVIDQTHPQLLDAAVAAVRAIPGLPHGGIDFLIKDPSLPPDEQRAAICEINSTPGQTANDFPLYGPRRSVSGEMIEHYAGAHGLATSPPVDVLSLQLEITGVVQGVGYRDWFAGRAETLGCRGWVENMADGSVSAVLVGGAEEVSALVSRAVAGPRTASVESVVSTPWEAHVSEGFEVR